MALPDKRDEAEKLYTRQDLSCREIAGRLGVDQKTVYRWKAEAAGKGALDWDARRRTYNLAPEELFAIYGEAVKSWLIKIQEDPELLSDAKATDALVKHVSILQKLDTRKQYLGVALDLIKTINGWLGEHEPELKDRMAACWEGIYAALKEYATSKRLF